MFSFGLVEMMYVRKLVDWRWLMSVIDWCSMWVDEAKFWSCTTVVRTVCTVFEASWLISCWLKILRSFSRKNKKGLSFSSNHCILPTLHYSTHHVRGVGVACFDWLIFFFSLRFGSTKRGSADCACEWAENKKTEVECRVTITCNELRMNPHQNN